MLKSLKYAAVAAVLYAVPCIAQSQINGVVTNEEGEYLPGSHVSLNGDFRGTHTDFQGSFSFQNLKPGTYYLRASYLGYQDYRDTIYLSENPVNLLIQLNAQYFQTDEVVVNATRLSQNAPATFKNLDKNEIEKINLGQDIPFIIESTPSVVSTSDAGAGVGYTGLRIRGSDQTRINVTVNGIPINDSESQGVFWVNMPDLSSSLSSMQIQRGLGTSTNGSGAFGASINLETNVVNPEGGGRIFNSIGSFNTRKHNVEFNSGLQNNGFAVEGRLSKIASDGYVDRATSDLQSYYMSAGYFGKKTSVKFLTFGGGQETYQSWNGVPQSRIENDVAGMLAHATNEGFTEEETQNLLNSGRTYNYYTYENQIDKYNQSHYQLHLVHAFSPRLTLTAAGHYTIGKGYFEEYKARQRFSNYGLANPIIGEDTLTRTDLIRRRWLDNDFYGGTFSLRYKTGSHNFTLGGGAHFYRGDHFGEVVWAGISTTAEHLQRYYDNVGNKNDVSIYGKWEYNFEKWNFMADLQLRAVDYETFGTDKNLAYFDIHHDYLFFNPKIGARYRLDGKSSVYAYLGRGNREPVRKDFVEGPDNTTPKHETLNNLELGYTFSDRNLLFNVNAYYMDYENQLVLTGELNESGGAVRSNVDDSYRAGIELDGTYMFAPNFGVNLNAAFSQNKIRNFHEMIYDYLDDGVHIVRNDYPDVDISFSPSVVSAGTLIYRPFKNFEFNFISKYVGKQYLDNTANDDRSIAPYWINNIRLNYGIDDIIFKKVELSLLVNNVFDVKYESNGYTYSYGVNHNIITENFYYPQAGINFLVGLNLIF